MMVCGDAHFVGARARENCGRFELVAHAARRTAGRQLAHVEDLHAVVLDLGHH